MFDEGNQSRGQEAKMDGLALLSEKATEALHRPSSLAYHNIQLANPILSPSSIFSDVSKSVGADRFKDFTAYR